MVLLFFIIISILLTTQMEEFGKDKSDMRKLLDVYGPNADLRPDIVASELLGSFGYNVIFSYPKIIIRLKNIHYTL